MPSQAQADVSQRDRRIAQFAGSLLVQDRLKIAGRSDVHRVPAKWCEVE